MEHRRLPIIRLWNRLLVPIQGDMTDPLADALREEVLRTIHVEGAVGLVLDLTAVWVMDSHLCAVISELASSAKLMGTPTVVCGMSPEIAMTLQAMGVELTAVESVLNLEQGLVRLGLEVTDTRAFDDLENEAQFTTQFDSGEDR
jgi:rsbT antagonist protein RsbS